MRPEQQRRLSVQLCLCLVAASVSASAPHTVHPTPQAVRGGLYEGRSGNIVVAPNPLTFPDGLLGLAANGEYVTPVDPQHSNNQHTMSWSSVASFLAHSMGLSVDVTPPLSKAAQTVVRGSIVDRPSASVVLTVPGLGAASLQQHGLTELTRFFDTQAHSFKLTDASFPHPALSMATTLATGQPISKHGIVGDEWATFGGGREKAFSCTESQAMFHNVAELFSQTFHGKSLTVSASLDQQFASAGGVEAGQDQHSDAVLYYVEQSQSFQRRGQSAPFGPSMTAERVLGSITGGRIGQQTQTIWQQLRDAGVLVTVQDDSTVAVRVHDGQAVVFSQDQLYLFRELLFLSELPAALRMDPLLSSRLQDAYPDYLHVTLSSLKRLASSDECRSGECQQFAAAAQLVDAAVPLLLSRLNTLYPEGAALNHVALLGTHQTHSADTEQRVADIISSVAQQFSVHRVVPSSTSTIDVNLPHDELQLFCAALDAQLAQVHFQAYCPVVDPEAGNFLDLSSTFGRVSLQTVVPKRTSNATAASQARFQIILWLVIVLVLVVYAAAYAIAFMEFKRDPLLYSKFNPNWNSRK